MKKLIYPLISLLFLFSFSAKAYQPGYTMFRDIGFGAVVGLGVGALVLISTQSPNNIAPRLATSALIGAGAGLVLGIVELTLEHTTGSEYSSETPGLKIRPLVSFLPDEHDVSYYKQELFSNPLDLIDPSKTAVGLNIKYVFPN